MAGDSHGTKARKNRKQSVKKGACNTTQASFACVFVSVLDYGGPSGTTASPAFGTVTLDPCFRLIVSSRLGKRAHTQCQPAGVDAAAFHEIYTLWVAGGRG